MSIQPTEIGLQVSAPDECLLLSHEERRNPGVELVVGGKNHHERQIIEVGDVSVSSTIRVSSTASAS
jgi:hypothetical protein